MTDCSAGVKFSYMLTDITRAVIYHTMEEIVKDVLYYFFPLFSVVYQY